MSMSRIARVLLLGGLVAASLVASRPAHAQWNYLRPIPSPYIRPHFYVGVGGAGTLVLGETGPRSFLTSGGGFHITLGGRINRVFALELGWTPTFHNNEYDIYGHPVATLGLSAYTIDGKFYPGARGPVQPFFVVGAGMYVLGDAFGALGEGPGYQIGGGIDLWLGRWASIGLKVQYRGVALVDYDWYEENTYLSLLTGTAEFNLRF